MPSVEEYNNRYLPGTLQESHFFNFSLRLPSFKGALAAAKVSGRRETNDVARPTCALLRDNTQKLSHADATNLHEIDVQQGDSLGRYDRVTC